MAKNQKLVFDKPLEEAWTYWYEVILGNDRNSICQQMIRAIWDDVLFRLIIEDRSETNVSNPSEVHTNQLIFEFLIRNYIDNQVSGIRRELDHYDLRGERGVYSLYSLVKEIETCQESITREKYFEILDLTYDIQNATERTRLPIFITANQRAPERLTKAEDIALSTSMHLYFDKISGKSADTRMPNDLLSKDFFRVIDFLFREIKYICDICDKHVAHAAIPESRKLIENNYSTVTSLEIWEAHKKIFIIMNILTRLLTGGYLKPFNYSEDVFFNNWDEPLVKAQDIPSLKEKFIRFRTELNSWGSSQVFE